MTVPDAITRALSTEPIVVFLKGTRQQPTCRFSGQLVELLDTLLPEYAAFDIKADPEVKAAAMELSGWDAFPQFFIGGRFIGGVDVAKEWFVTGELARRLGVEQPELPTPQIHLSVPAHEALAKSVQGSPVRIDRDARKTLRLAVSRRNSSDLAVKLGEITFVFDVVVARHLDGLRIDWLQEPGGFVLRTPADSVRDLAPRELSERLSKGDNLQVVDVRTLAEFRRGHLMCSQFLTKDTFADLLALDRRTPLVFVCQEGTRSRNSAEHFVAEGFVEVYRLEGGLDRWQQELGPLDASGEQL